VITEVLTQVLGAIQRYKLPPVTATCPEDPELLLCVGPGLTSVTGVTPGLLILACMTAKLLLMVLNAVRNGSPLPAPGPVPMFTFANVIDILDLLII